MNHEPLRYRPDIDGLRAVAVLAVIGYHAFAGAVPGGFVGVDIFFVISGFLISGILFSQFAEGRFSLAEFYARRVRRIFPALALMLVGVWVAGWFVLLADEYELLEKHIAGGATFFSNVLLWREAGYFDVQSELKPLLHLWSLGIEEQFYLFWPPLLYFCWRRGLNALTLAIAIVAVSFSLNVTLLPTHAIATFFLPHTRIWELLLGAVLAYCDCFKRQEIKAALERVVFASSDSRNDMLIPNLQAWIGVALITYAVFELDRGMLYPGWPAALPTVGAAFVIAAGGNAWVNRKVLANRAAVFVGLISYPLYLWHWPLLSFLRITESGAPSRALRLSAVALSFVLAAITYYAVELPIRHGITLRTRWRLASLAASLAVVASFSFFSYQTKAFTSRIPHFVTELQAYQLPGPDRTCKEAFPTEAEDCLAFAAGGRITTALVGDSHAGHFLDGIGAALARKGENVVLLGQSICPPFINIESFWVGGTDVCRRVNATVADSVGANPTIKRVVLAFRGALVVSGHGYGDIERDQHVVFRVAGTTFSPVESLRVALERTVDFFLQKNKEVWLIHQVPELGFSVRECIGRPVSFERKVRAPCAVPRTEVDARQAAYRLAVDEVKQKLPALRIFDPVPFMCDERWCHAIVGDKVLYRDDDHLSREGSLFLTDKFSF